MKFSIEDTSDGSYRDITNAFVEKGWERLNSKKNSTIEIKKTKTKDLPLLLWTRICEDQNHISTR